MKTMIVNALYHPNVLGGAEKIAQVLAEGLRDAGNETVVVTLSPERQHRIGQVNGIKVHYLGLKNLYWPYSGARHAAPVKALWHGINSYNPWMARDVAQLVDAERPDVVNTHNLAGLSYGVWAAVKRRRVPVVHTLHDYGLLCPSSSMRTHDANCARPCGRCTLYTQPGRRLSQEVDAVVGVSRHTLDRHLDQGCFSRTPRRHVIYNGLPGVAAPPAAATPSAGPLRLGFVGRLIPDKGIRNLVAHLHEWPATQCTLVVAGKGTADFERTLREAAPAHVRFLGHVDPQAVYRAVDVLIVPSLWNDPLPTTVIEAYQHGVPVIASRRGGLPELVDHGSTGALFDPDEPGSLNAAIAMFLSDRGLAERMRPAVMAKARGFTIERMRGEYLALLEQVARD